MFVTRNFEEILNLKCLNVVHLIKIDIHVDGDGKAIIDKIMDILSYITKDMCNVSRQKS